MKTCVFVMLLTALVTIVGSGCGTRWTPTEKGAVAGYVVGSGVGAGIGAALGNPALGAVAGGPVGAGVGVLTARSMRSDHNMRALQDDLARLDAELALQRESLRRLARERWLEP